MVKEKEVVLWLRMFGYRGWLDSQESNQLALYQLSHLHRLVLTTHKKQWRGKNWPKDIKIRYTNDVIIVYSKQIILDTLDFMSGLYQGLTLGLLRLNIMTKGCLTIESIVGFPGDHPGIPERFD